MSQSDFNKKDTQVNAQGLRPPSAIQATQPFKHKGLRKSSQVPAWEPRQPPLPSGGLNALHLWWFHQAETRANALAWM